MAIFLTGSTGYIGAHVAANLLERHSESLNLLVRAHSEEEARRRLWRAFQLHMDFPRFEQYLRSQIAVFCGDLTVERLALDDAEYSRLARSTDSVIHCAASLNRKSEKSCLNVNLRGTLHVIELAAQARDHHGLRRFSHVSTVAVCGRRRDEVVQEDTALEWDRGDYDPYARTKKFCEYLVRHLLPGVPRTFFRPSIVLGDSRRAETNQFEMVRAFAFLAGLPLLPFRPTDRIDIVPADFVADSIAALHQKEKPAHEIYHLSSGQDSETFRRITDALARAQGKRGPVFVPTAERLFTRWVDRLSNGSGKIASLSTLLKVFLPYLVWNTVFDNARVVRELGRAPASFSSYCYPLLRFSRDHRFTYNYRDWPSAPTDAGTARHSEAAASPREAVAGDSWE